MTSLTVPEADSASAALLLSQAGPHAARVFVARPTLPEFSLASPLFRVLLLRRLRRCQMPMPSKTRPSWRSPRCVSALRRPTQSSAAPAAANSPSPRLKLEGAGAMRPRTSSACLLGAGRGPSLPPARPRPSLPSRCVGRPSSPSQLRGLSPPVYCRSRSVALQNVDGDPPLLSEVLVDSVHRLGLPSSVATLDALGDHRAGMPNGRCVSAGSAERAAAQVCRVTRRGRGLLQTFKKHVLAGYVFDSRRVEGQIKSPTTLSGCGRARPSHGPRAGGEA